MARRRTQLGEPDEHQAQAILGVHHKITQQAKIFEDIVAQVLRFIDDEDGELLGLADETGDLSTFGG